MKSTQGEVNRRVEQVVKIILFGGEFADIRQYSTENDEATRRPWGVCDRTLCTYQQRAYELIEKQVEKNRDKVFARHIQQRRQMFALAMEAGDLSTALQIVKDEADLHGIYPVVGKASGETNSMVNVNVANNVEINIVTAAVQKAMNNPEYLDFLESRALARDRDASAICSENRAELANGSPSPGYQPGPGESV